MKLSIVNHFKILNKPEFRIHNCSIVILIPHPTGGRGVVHGNHVVSISTDPVVFRRVRDRVTWREVLVIGI